MRPRFPPPAGFAGSAPKGMAKETSATNIRGSLDEATAMRETANGRSDIDKIEAKLPPKLARFMRRMRQPGSRWFRIPMGSLLIVGGILGFLPILGFWMLPLGLLLIAEDYPPVQRGIRKSMVNAQRWWRRQRRRFVRS